MLVEAIAYIPACRRTTLHGLTLQMLRSRYVTMYLALLSRHSSVWGILEDRPGKRSYKFRAKTKNNVGICKVNPSLTLTLLT